MSDLLEFALAAHGGLDRWREVTKFQARASATGAFFSLKGHADSLRNVELTVHTREQWTSIDGLAGVGNRAVCTPSQTTIERDDGKTKDVRDNPLSAFDGHVAETPWDDLHLAYFVGYASWNYFNDPFILTLPGFKTEEIGTWEENGETWRRLAVTFPDNIAAHCSEQTFYFNSEGLLVRMDYAPYVRGRMPAAHYLLGHKNVGGLVLPERRRIYRRDPSGNRIPEPVVIAVDYADIRLS